MYIKKNRCEVYWIGAEPLLPVYVFTPLLQKNKDDIRH